MECILCYDDIETLPICTFFDNTTEESNICINCFHRGINDTLDNTIKQFANETCGASITRTVSTHLPTHITMDMTGRGNKIKYIICDDTITDGELKSKYSKEEIDTINKYMDELNEYSINDDPLFLLKHIEYFEKYK